MTPPDALRAAAGRSVLVAALILFGLVAAFLVMREALEAWV